MAKKNFIISLFFVFIVPFIAFANNASSYDAMMFTASSIKVDVTDRDSASARRQAINNGQSLGLFKVLERIVEPSQFETLPEITDDEIADLVQDISVSDEKTSKVRYIATLDIRYKPEAIKSFLKNIGMPFVQAPSPPCLLLPVYYDSSKNPLSWNELNSWVDVWKKADTGLIPLIIPENNENESVNIDITDVVNINPSLALEWQKFYKTDCGVIVAEVRNSGSSLYFKATKYNNGNEEEVIQFNTPYKNLTSALSSLVSKYVTKTENKWRDAHVINIADDTFITAVIPLKTISDWLSVQQKLKEISTITKIELKAIKKDRAQIELWFANGLENLSVSLKQKDLQLIEISDDVYEISKFHGENTGDTEEEAFEVEE